MHKKTALAIAGIGFGIFAAILAFAPSAAADYDSSKVYDETFNNYTTALNVTANFEQMMLFEMKCSQNDVDVLYVWQPAGMDLSYHIDLGPVADANQTRWSGWLMTPEHFATEPEMGLGKQFGQDFWLNTTTWLAGPYYLLLNRCINVDGFYNVTWTSSATGAASDNNNFLAQATALTDGLSVAGSLTHTTDQMDFFRLDASFTPPPYLYIQLTGIACGTPPTWGLEFFNATGVALETPAPILSGGCGGITAPQAYRLPGSGTWYLRIFANAITQGYSFTFTYFSYSPNRPTCIDYTTTCTVTDNAFVSGAANGLNFSYERVHMYKIFLSENDTIVVNASSTQIDILARIWNQPSDLSTPLQKGFSSHAFTGAIDWENISYRMTSTELAATTGWYIIEVRINSDLPPEGVYNLRVRLNDRPIALDRSISNPLTTSEDTPIALFDLNTLFYDNDCKLGDTPDCTPRIVPFGAAPAEFTFAFDGSHLVNVTATAEWSGTGCMQYLGFDPMNLSATATLCVAVAAVNDAPVVVSTQTERNLTEDQVQQAVFIASWFADADNDTANPLTYSVSGNDNVTITIDQLTGLAEFDPELNFNGQNSVIFTACDINNSCVDFPLPFIVFPVNDAPTARGTLPFMACDEDGSATMDLNAVLILGVVQSAFWDIDGDTLSYRLSNPPADLDITILGPVITVRPKPNVAGIYFFEVKAFDGFLESFPASVRVTVAPVNDVPVIDTRAPSTNNPTVQESFARDFSVTASDVDGDTLHYQWFIDSVGQNNALFANFTYHAALTDEPNRSVVVKVNVSDGNGGYAETSWTLEITNLNQAPTITITSPTSGHRTFLEGDDIDFSSVATDPDGDTLTYTWSSDRVFAPIGDQQTFSTKLAPGTHDVTVRVSDGHGGEARTNVTIVVQPKAVDGGGGGGSTIIILGVVLAAAVGGAVVFMMRRGKKPQSPSP